MVPLNDYLPCSRFKAVRMFPTVVGHCGRECVRKVLLQRHPKNLGRILDRDFLATVIDRLDQLAVDHLVIGHVV